MRLLDKSLPIWVSELDGFLSTERLDNNWYSPAAVVAENELHKVAQKGKFALRPLIDLCERRGINTGSSPDDDGQIGLIEGRNLRPNYVIPLFTKFGSSPMDIRPDDLLIGKDGEPGTVSLVTASLLRYCKQLTVGGHVYHIRLASQYRELSPFISAFLNSRNGQAMLRRRIAGGTTPTIRKTDIGQIPVLFPTDRQCPSELREAIVETQDRIIQSMDNLGPSRNIAAVAGFEEVDIKLPVNWAGGGATRSSRLLR
jgi:hypothetical protein